MENDTWLRTCIFSVSQLPSQEQWSNEVHQPIFAGIFKRLGKTLSEKVADHIDAHCDWRPTKAQIWEVAVKLSSTAPSMEEAFAEFYYKLRHAGYESPRFSHPTLTRIALGLGGWRTLYREEPARGILYRDFGEAYKRQTETWKEEVVVQLRLPPGERNYPLYFPKNKDVPKLLPWMEAEIESGVLAIEAPSGPPAISREEATQIMRQIGAKVKLLSPGPSDPKFRRLFGESIEGYDRVELERELELVGQRMKVEDDAEGMQ